MLLFDKPSCNLRCSSLIVLVVWRCSCGISGLLCLSYQQHCHVKVSMKKKGGQNKQSGLATKVSNNSLQTQGEKTPEEELLHAWLKEPLCTKKCLLTTCFYRNSPRMTNHLVHVIFKRAFTLRRYLNAKL